MKYNDYVVTAYKLFETSGPLCRATYETLKKPDQYEGVRKILIDSLNKQHKKAGIEVVTSVVNVYMYQSFIYNTVN